MRVAFLTLGCKVNFYETEKLEEAFRDRGHDIVSFGEEADVYVVNTCTVTNIADRKSRKMLHRARGKNERALVVAVGCYVDSARRSGEKPEGIDLMVGNEEKSRLVDILEERLQEPEKRQEGEKSQAARGEEHTRAYLKVQDGCNLYCTYCIIPYVRGELASRPQDQVLEEVAHLAQRGVQEVVLTGIHLSSYGVDLRGKKNFLELGGKPLLSLVEAVAQVPGIRRIRLGSLEPRIITEEFAEGLSRQEKVCPQFHLSLQSGCDETLRRMNRRYTGEEYLEKLHILRRYFSAPAVTTDVIVGFPGETEEEFDATCDFVRRAAFSRLHVFKYSRRRGTMADAMEGQVPEQIKARRSDRLIHIGRELEREYCVQLLGQDTRVLLEEVSSRGGQAYLTGYNERYVRVSVPVEDPVKAEKLCNQIVTVRLRGLEESGGCTGEFAGGGVVDP